MKLVLFIHSLASCWNHGNAHFLRGIARAWSRRGDPVAICEPAQGWSREGLAADGHDASAFEAAYPDLAADAYGPEPDLDRLLDGADVVLVHEWNAPELVAAIGAHRIRGGRYRLFFHDTHHRAVSDPVSIQSLLLDGYDGVLAFGEALSEVYRSWGWGGRVFTWHEAADTTHFLPPLAQDEEERAGAVWIGNWGDGERSAEIGRYLLRPAAAAGLPLDIYGVRYPPEAKAALEEHGARYHGWLANAAAPQVFARHFLTVHVPRRFYVERLPGIPTIRVFEAMACGIPLLCAPWQDSEGLFRPGEDFLIAHSEAEMAAAMRALASDAGLRARLARSGLAAIRARHSCAHRVQELIDIVRGLDARQEKAAA